MFLPSQLSSGRWAARRSWTLRRTAKWPQSPPSPGKAGPTPQQRQKKRCERAVCVFGPTPGYPKPEENQGKRRKGLAFQKGQWRKRTEKKYQPEAFGGSKNTNNPWAPLATSQVGCRKERNKVDSWASLRQRPRVRAAREGADVVPGLWAGASREKSESSAAQNKRWLQALPHSTVGSVHSAM